MRRSEEMPLDPFEIAELEAIEAALAGREVDPEYSELAELSVLLATDQQSPSEEFTRGLDAMVARRFEEPAVKSPREVQDGLGASTRLKTRIAEHRGGALLRRPAVAATFTAALAAFVVVVALNSGGSPSNGPAASSPASPQTLHVAPSRNPSAAPPSVGPIQKSAPSPTTAQHGSPSTAGAPPASFGTASGVTVTPAPVSNGHRQVQSAQLTLATPGTRIDAVAQEVFNVVGRENGIVKNSQVTQAGQGGDGYASFNLNIPTSNLQDTLDQLSRLQYAHVVSRTDATQDVNNQFLSDQRQLADARALRTSLLKQLATAYTTAAIDSLKAQIHDAEASISSDEATLSSLQHRISFSSLNVQVNQGTIAPLAGHRATSTGSGLTLGRAAHDAVKVLTVAAGVILIGLAALLPIALLVALVAWVAYRLRKHRREQALDAA